MKKPTCFISASRCGKRISTFLLCAGLFGGHSLMAGESASSGKATVATAPEDDTFQNWINLSLGGLILGGDEAQFKQANHNSSTVNGGIEDLHYEKSLGKKTQLTIDGHAIVDNTDYKVKVTLTQQDVGYISAGYTLFRTWYDGNGGYFPGNGAFFPPGYGNELALDRGDIWVELGLRMANLPEITLRYDHLYRYGQKDSTSWGTTADTGLTYATSGYNQRKITPSFYNINETRDILTAEAKQTVFGNTELNLGMRFEYNNNNDSLNERNFPENSTAVKTNPQRYITQDNQLQMDMLNGHFSSVTRFNDQYWLTLGYSYTGMNSDIGGSRIQGLQYNPPYIAAYRASGFLNLSGGSIAADQVINFNLMCTPIKDLTIIPSLRIGIENVDSQSYFTNVPRTGALAPFTATSSNHFNDIEQGLDIRYAGIENILLYARADWLERCGDYQDQQMNTQSDPNLSANNVYFSQKYALGANWYPLTHLNIALQYFYKTEQNNYNWGPGATGVINALNSNTNDVNARISWKPFTTLSLVSRYDMQYVTMLNQGIADITLNNIQSATISNNIFSENVTWTPLARLYVQGDVAIVLSETKTPASNITMTGLPGPSVLNFGNNYWTASCQTGFVIDDKTDLQIGYTYYHATNYQNNSASGMPYGAGAIENTVTAGIVRKLTKNISISLRYGYYTYNDQTSGYHNNYTANVIYSGLQFKF
ncbi:MAG: hypothetical protein WCH43_06230 [Verrucomicrobiota bacterium]